MDAHSTHLLWQLALWEGPSGPLSDAASIPCVTAYFDIGEHYQFSSMCVVKQGGKQRLIAIVKYLYIVKRCSESLYVLIHFLFRWARFPSFLSRSTLLFLSTSEERGRHERDEVGSMNTQKLFLWCRLLLTVRRTGVNTFGQAQNWSEHIVFERKRTKTGDATQKRLVR